MPPNPETTSRQDGQNILSSLLDSNTSILFASACMVDGRSYAHAARESHPSDAHRTAAIMSSLLGLLESFARETLKSTASYTSLATEHGSIVIARVPSKRRMHALCVCSDNTSNLAMTIRSTLDTAKTLSDSIDAAA